jgi:aminoglycoside 6'-N-acetyltransferase I
MRELLAKGGVVIVGSTAEHHGVGFLELSLRSDYVPGAHLRPTAYIEGWYVLPDLRGQGIGAMMMSAAESWCAQNGFAELASDAESDNEAGLAAHKHLGFTIVERTVHLIKAIARHDTNERTTLPLGKPVPVLLAHEPSYDYWIELEPGEEIEVHREDTRFRGWFWCTNGAGKSAWVPKHCFQMVSATKAVCQEWYTSRELSVRPGDLVTPIYSETSWVLARDVTGSEGWIPAANLAGSVE